MDLLLNKRLLEYALYPRDAYINFQLGLEYMNKGQYASAISYLLRAAELTDDPDLAYTCIMLNYKNLNSQAGRTHSAKGQLLHAIALQPERPEAYYVLSLFYETKQEWQEAYTVACIAESLPPGKVYADVGYPGTYGPTLQKAVTGWYLGYGKQSRRIFRELEHNPLLKPEHRTIIQNNIKNLGA